MALGYMRRHRRWLYGFLWLVIAAFIVLYVPTFMDPGGGSADAVARIGRTSISVNEFRTAFLEHLRTYEAATGRRIDYDDARRQGMPEGVLGGLIQQALVTQECHRLGITMDNAALLRAIQTLPQFQRDGRFIGGGEVRRRLDLMGMSEGQFLAELRASLLRQRLQDLVTAGVGVSPAEVEREYRSRHEQVRVEYVLVPDAPLREGIQPTEAEVKERFEKGRETTYRFPERRVISYLLVERDAVRRAVSVTDHEIQAYYEAHDDDFTRPGQVCASHILIAVKSSPEGEGHTDAEAEKLAEDALAQLNAGADFATLARKVSEDPGSASKGGDLGCFPRGEMVPEFDQAAFQLEPGETSGLVRSDFGYHIIHVTSRQEDVTIPLDAVRSQINAQLVARMTEEELESRAMAASSAARGRGGLEAAAEELGLEVQKTPPLALGGDAGDLSPAAVAAAFEVQAGEVAPQPFAVSKGIAIIGVAEVQPPRAAELKEVEEQVRKDLIESRALGQALDQAQQLRAKALAQGLENAARAMGLTRKETPGLVGRGKPLGELGANAHLTEVVYELPEKTLSDPVRVASGYAVVSVLEKKPFDQAAFEKDKESLTESLTNAARRQMFEAYLGQLAERFKVERLPAFRTALGGE